MKRQTLLLCILTTLSDAYQLCVVGATSGLGRELVYQGAYDKNISVLALSGSSKPLTLPCRENSFELNKISPPFVNSNVHRDNYWKDLSQYDFENIVFTTNAPPFKEDYSDRLMSKIILELPKSCKHVTLVSADCVKRTFFKRDEIEKAIITEWYLKDSHRAKIKQERILRLRYLKMKHPQLKQSIYRPKVLTYGTTSIPTTSRQSLATEILDDLNL
jgi:hypothetical protein